MSDDMKDHGCDAHQDELPELALGVLTGRDRAQALAHVESCPRCAEELEQLSRAADAVVQVAPEVEPPMGFEMRLFERMGVADVRRPRRRRHGRAWVGRRAGRGRRRGGAGRRAEPRGVVAGAHAERAGRRTRGS